jgi:hypothetical protein
MMRPAPPSYKAGQVQGVRLAAPAARLRVRAIGHPPGNASAPPPSSLQTTAGPRGRAPSFVHGKTPSPCRGGSGRPQTLGSPAPTERQRVAPKCLTRRPDGRRPWKRISPSMTQLAPPAPVYIGSRLVPSPCPTVGRSTFAAPPAAGKSGKARPRVLLAPKARALLASQRAAPPAVGGP